MPHLDPLGAGIIMVMPDTDAVRWYRAPGDQWGTVFAVALLTVLLAGCSLRGGHHPGARALSLTGAVLVCCAGCAVVFLRGRLASDDVTQDRLDIRGYTGTARKHGLNAPDVLHQLMLGNPWLPQPSRSPSNTAPKKRATSNPLPVGVNA